LSASPRKRNFNPSKPLLLHDLTAHLRERRPVPAKTRVLVERYLHILREHKLSIDQIVAITFTNRAANERRAPQETTKSHSARASETREGIG